MHGISYKGVKLCMFLEGVEHDVSSTVSIHPCFCSVEGDEIVVGYVTEIGRASCRERVYVLV